MSLGRTPPGVRGLKQKTKSSLGRHKPCRTPPGVRGLKPTFLYRPDLFSWSHPTRGAWIETLLGDAKREELQSHPTRGAWIETERRVNTTTLYIVAPHPGCVD